MVKNIFLVIIIFLASVQNIFASDNDNSLRENVADNTIKIREPAEFEEVINEYKTYVSTISPEIRDEIIAYRKEVAKINKEKRLMYRKLSQEAQEYLKKEQAFKKRLPMNKKALINTQNPGEKIKNK